MQQNMLTLWSQWLNSNALVSELEAVTCHWEQRKLAVLGTRMLPPGQFNTYKKFTAHRSSLSGGYAVAARLLQVASSAKCPATLNHMKLITMTQVIEKYSNDNSDLSVHTDQEFATYYESNQESQGSAKEKEEPVYAHETLSK
ncbi:hypothetical protein HMPREF1544_04469 [Mucor circinelloides 1006PhL]|uniref:Uncharacterized protein n=1 Tax=Mucor circinelloides f. circinelloides (strain 1006PhL) TaxID=1220926 RepID=S2K8U4_MUCC1|nr:hypothetical protein HMPREF1544_04469 [Mucor circinelloides 1006PhL]